MLSVIYVSVVDPALNETDIAALVEQARANNARDDLTGVLIYNEQNFMQLIEGPADRVEACLGLIRADRRHSGMIELRRRPIAARASADFTVLYSPLFRDNHAAVASLAAIAALDPQDSRMMANFLALGSGAAAPGGGAD